MESHYDNKDNVTKTNMIKSGSATETEEKRKTKRVKCYLCCCCCVWGRKRNRPESVNGKREGNRWRNMKAKRLITALCIYMWTYIYLKTRCVFSTRRRQYAA